MKEYIYKPKGVCSSEFVFKIDESDIIRELKVSNGCSGNLQAISALLVGKELDEVITKLIDIKCGNKDTSCPMQIALALEKYKKKK
jgi:uncharacterized protein (TIGR03905 family)